MSKDHGAFGYRLDNCAIKWEWVSVKKFKYFSARILIFINYSISVWVISVTKETHYFHRTPFTFFLIMSVLMCSLMDLIRYWLTGKKSSRVERKKIYKGWKVFFFQCQISATLLLISLRSHFFPTLMCQHNYLLSFDFVLWLIIDIFDTFFECCIF